MARRTPKDRLEYNATAASLYAANLVKRVDEGHLKAALAEASALLHAAQEAFTILNRMDAVADKEASR